MAEYSIAETARRTGFTTSTLRYYDEVGLARPTSRTAAGYRVYDERAVERLQIVARVKRLGLSLDDARTVADRWETGECSDVQTLLRTMVGERLLGTQRDIAERMALAADLQAAAAHLTGPATTGRCGADCACFSDTPATVTRGVVITPRVDTTTQQRLVCSLAGDAMPGRVADWQLVLARVERRTRRDDDLRLHFPLDADLAAELGRLCAAEHECCPFFTFAITAADGSLTLDISAPAEADALIASVFGVGGMECTQPTLEHA